VGEGGRGLCASIAAFTVRELAALALPLLLSLFDCLFGPTLLAPGRGWAAVILGDVLQERLELGGMCLECHSEKAEE